MMHHDLPAITPIYAALLALMYMGLSLRLALLRKKTGIGIGDGGDAAVARLVRVHGNFIEYVPITLLLLVLLEMRGAPIWSLYLLNSMLLLGRVLHAQGLSRRSGYSRGRFWGMILTLNTLLLAAVGLLVQAVV